MWNKQEEQEICVQSKGFDLTAITETCCHSSCDWNVVTRGYTSLRRDRPGTCRCGFALNWQHLECAKLCLRLHDERGESLWVRTTELAGKGDTGVSVCSREPKQVEEVAENFYRQQETASQSQTLWSLWRNFATLKSTGEAQTIQDISGKH